MHRKRLKCNNMSGYSRKYFISSLINFIASVSDSNNRIILAAGINEHTEKGILAKKFKRIGFKNVHTEIFKQVGSVSHAKGSDLIDGM